MTQTSIQSSWDEFIKEYTSEILPIYLGHEQTFDAYGFHGRRHLTRSLIFAEIIARFYFMQGEKSIDFDAIRIAVAFHDSAREGNGIDTWEAESSDNCKQYLLQQGKGESYAKQTSSMITQKKKDIKTRTEQIVYDVDVIEILRVLFSRHKLRPEELTYNRSRFRPTELFFLGVNELHQQLPSSILNLQGQFLNEFWNFLEETEKTKLSAPNPNFVKTYLNAFRENKVKYSLMNLCYDFEWK